MPTNERGSILLETCLIVPILLLIFAGVISIHEHLEKRMQEIIQDRNVKTLQLETNAATERASSELFSRIKHLSPADSP